MTSTTIATSAALALASAIALSAQTPTLPRPTDPKPSQTAPARTDDKTMTVAGCLKAWDAAAVTTPATPATTGAAGAMAGKYLLTNVVRFGAAGSTGTTPPAQVSAAGGTQYVVMAESNVNLAAHVNHQVQITGTLSDQPAMSPRPGDAPPAKPGESSTRPGMGDAMPHQSATITATAVTMVSATCTPASH